MSTSDPSTAFPSDQTGSFLDGKEDRNKRQGDQKHLCHVFMLGVFSLYLTVKLLFGCEERKKHSVGKGLLQLEIQCIVTSCALYFSVGSV